MIVIWTLSVVKAINTDIDLILECMSFRMLVSHISVFHLQMPYLRSATANPTKWGQLSSSHVADGLR